MASLYKNTGWSYQRGRTAKRLPVWAGILEAELIQRYNFSKNKDKKFKNSQDLACIFQNFKNTKDLLYDHFGIAFPAN